jgi:hypothetical protein
MLDNAANGRNTLVRKLPSYNLGGETESHSFYAAAVADGSSDVKVSSFVAGAPGIILRSRAKLSANLGAGTFDVFFAKAGTSHANNRIRFSSGEGTTTKYLDADPTTSSPINAQLIFAKGDLIDIRVTNTSGGPVNCNASFSVRYTSTEATG